MRRPDPRSLCVIAAGIVLAAGSAAPQPPAAPAAGPPTGGAELSAAELNAAQQSLAGSVLDALGPEGWTYPDGSELAPGELPVPHPVACTGPVPGTGTASGQAAGPRRHLLALQLSGSAPDSPEAARDQAQAVLLGSGAEMLSALTPGPGAPPDTDYTFTGAHANGTVVFAADDYGQSLQITSACSADPALAGWTGSPAV